MHVYAYAQFTYLSGESREKNRKIERERERERGGGGGGRRLISRVYTYTRVMHQIYSVIHFVYIQYVCDIRR